MPSHPRDADYMQLAWELAARGLGAVEPNPMVGCVLVANDQILGSGYHAKYGGPHAERAAIADAIARGHVARLPGATAYVTLEPCCHFGKTTPCTEALIEAQLARVVVAMLDPFEQVAGRGAEVLQQAGIQVDVAEMQAAGRELNAPYLKRLLNQRPWVIAKWAMSLDGKTATRTLDSQWISGEASRARVHELRGRVDAIIVGIGTALADNPRLTARSAAPPTRVALRVVVDSHLRIPLDSQLVQTARDFPTLVWCGPAASRELAGRLQQAGCIVEACSDPDRNQRLDQLLLHLAAQYQATNVLVEGGGGLLGGLMELGQCDETIVYVAPKLIGGLHAVTPISGEGFARVAEGPRCRRVEHQICGEDLEIRSRWDWPQPF